jgi:hypothetical protein
MHGPGFCFFQSSTRQQTSHRPNHHVRCSRPPPPPPPQRHGFGFGFANAFSSPLCYSCEYFCDAVARSSFFHPSIRHQTIHRPNRHSRRHRPPLIPPLLSSTVHELPPPLPVRANYFHWKYQGE